MCESAARPAAADHTRPRKIIVRRKSPPMSEGRVVDCVSGCRSSTSRHPHGAMTVRLIRAGHEDGRAQSCASGALRCVCSTCCDRNQSASLPSPGVGAVAPQSVERHIVEDPGQDKQLAIHINPFDFDEFWTVGVQPYSCRNLFQFWGGHVYEQIDGPQLALHDRPSFNSATPPQLFQTLLNH